MDSDEKRNFQRMAIKCGLEYTFKGESECYSGSAVNLSGNGILFETEHSIKAGAIIKIKVPSDKPTSIFRAYVKIVRVSAAPNGSGFQVAGEVIKKVEQ